MGGVTMKDMVTPFGGQRGGESANMGRSKSGAEDHRKTKGGASGDMKNDVTDLITHVHMKFSVQLESHLESATYCTLFLPRDSAIVTDSAHNERVVNSPEAERGSWFFMTMMNVIEKNLGAQDRQRKTDPPRLERGGSSGDAQVGS